MLEDKWNSMSKVVNSYPLFKYTINNDFEDSNPEAKEKNISLWIGQADFKKEKLLRVATKKNYSIT